MKRLGVCLHRGVSAAFVAKLHPLLCPNGRHRIEQVCHAHRWWVPVEDALGRDLAFELGEAAGNVAGLVEKPAFEQAPSNLASIGRYVLTPDIFEILRGQAPGAGGEIQLADAINTQAAAGQVEAVALNGQRFDCGSVKGFLEAIMHVAQRYGLV